MTMHSPERSPYYQEFKKLQRQQKYSQLSKRQKILHELSEWLWLALETVMIFALAAFAAVVLFVGLLL